MKIQRMASSLEKEINKQIDILTSHGKRAADCLTEAEAYYKKMHDIILSLEPVEFIIRQQNPQLCSLFDTLKEKYKPTPILEDHGGTEL